MEIMFRKYEDTYSTNAMSKQPFNELVHYTIKTRVTIQWHLPYAYHPQEKARNL